jgi:hypothetical protein
LEQGLSDLGLDKTLAVRVQLMAKWYKGTFLNWNKSSFCSRHVYDAACLALGESAFAPTLLAVCDLTFIVKKVVLSGDSEASGNDLHSVKVDTSSSGSLMDRLVQEIKKGNIPIVCQHSCWQRNELITDFRDHCNKQGCLLDMLQATDPKHQEPLLYWSAVCATHELVTWCAFEMLVVTPDKAFVMVTLQRVLFV